MARDDWSDRENDLIVADYLDMLRLDLSGDPYNKAGRNRRLQAVLTNRSRGSIEFKHQNISAVMLGLGQPWINGYKPASQFQASLVDAVIRSLPVERNWHTYRAPNLGGGTKGTKDFGNLWVGPAPTLSNEAPPVDVERMAIIANKFDVAARDERNRQLGADGEAFVYDYEKYRLTSEGRSDLAKRVIWTSREEGDGAGYDVSSFETDGRQKLLEVKTTNGWARTPFHVSRNELAVADQQRDAWVLFRVWNFARQPSAFEIRPPLQRHVELTPTSFKASFH